MSIIIIRKIPKTIVKPEPTTETPVKPAAENFVRYYPDGTVIPTPLPASYVPAETNLTVGAFQRHCGNCRAFSSITNLCSTYNSAVKPTYVCASWTSVI